MSQMKIHILSEPAYASTHWYENTLAGIYDRALKKGCNVCSINVDNEYALHEKALSCLSSDPILLLGTSVPWINEMIERIQKWGSRAIVLGCDIPRKYQKVSSINLNHSDALFNVVNYLIQCGRKQIALTGINPLSITDMAKREGFFSSLKSHGLPISEDAVFYNNGSLAKNEYIFGKSVRKFDAVICSNDVVAVSLLRYLAQIGVSVPDELFVVGFGNILLGQIVKPTLTTVELNYYEVGWRAVDILLYLSQNESVLSISATVKSRIIPRATTAFNDFLRRMSNNRTDDHFADSENLFYKDPQVIRYLKIEEWLNQLDVIDCGILIGIHDCTTYERLAEKLNISEGTIKYRLKKMIQQLGVRTKQDLFNIINTSVGISAIFDLYERKKKFH